MENTSTEEKTETSLKKKINVETSEQIVKKIEQHIFVRKACMGDEKTSKHSWAEEAIREKLSGEKDIQSCLLKTRIFTFLLDPKLEEQIEERIEISKQFSRSCSRKKWILDAFLQKIENERDNIKTHLDNSLDDRRNQKEK